MKQNIKIAKNLVKLAKSLIAQDKLEKDIKDLFYKIMKDQAIDMYEVVFNSESEKDKYIKDAWKDYGDDITEHISGEYEEDEWNELSQDRKNKAMIEAIEDNSKSIFDK